jgi:hypothetical protein
MTEIGLRAEVEKHALTGLWSSFLFLRHVLNHMATNPSNSPMINACMITMAPRMPVCLPPECYQGPLSIALALDSPHPI